MFGARESKSASNCKSSQDRRLAGSRRAKSKQVLYIRVLPRDVRKLQLLGVWDELLFVFLCHPIFTGDVEILAPVSLFGRN